MQVKSVKEALNSFVPVSLEEIDSVRLLDRMVTKFVMPAVLIPDLLSRLNGRYKILQISNNRISTYCTTYLDTNDYFFYHQHVTGREERNKIRFRKYESTGITYLEVKKRTYKKRTIKRRIINDFSPGYRFDDKALEFIKYYVPEQNFMLKPTLMVRFKRITLVGAEIKERTTIDYDISFSDLDDHQINLPSITVIELKREGFIDKSPISGILKELSVHPSGFSKYCIGMAIMYDHPRKNILKKKLLLINKIENESDKCFKTR
jgi:hypothetical protein